MYMGKAQDWVREMPLDKVHRISIFMEKNRNIGEVGPKLLSQSERICQSIG